MKELSIEEKAKAYDKALARAKEWRNIKEPFSDTCTCVVESIFPELKESEDEKIRKDIIYFLSRNTFQFGEDIDKYKSWIAWLEKQGEKLPVGFYYVNSEGKKFYSDTFKYGNVTLHIEKQGEKPQGKTALEATNEEKVENADKVSPKFKKGQWIVWQDKCYKVNYNGCGYELVDQNGLSTSLEYGTIDENAHIWDIIQDAKAGDVLASYNSVFIFQREYIAGKPTAYCGIMNGCFVQGLLGCWTNEQCYPATKEQRDLLFKKMYEAGYAWDKKKLELKKRIE